MSESFIQAPSLNELDEAISLFYSTHPLHDLWTIQVEFAGQNLSYLQATVRLVDRIVAVGFSEILMEYKKSDSFLGWTLFNYDSMNYATQVAMVRAIRNCPPTP